MIAQHIAMAAIAQVGAGPCEQQLVPVIDNIMHSRAKSQNIQHNTEIDAFVG